MLFFSLTLLAQDVSEKYNVRLQRIEYYNSAGAFIGFSRENTKYNLLEFYDSSGVLVRSYKQSDLLLTKNGLDADSSIAGIRRWNIVRQRYEVFDSLGKVRGHFEFDHTLRRWNYSSDR